MEKNQIIEKITKKQTNKKNFYLAVAVMIGYIIGVGMFGLPYLVSKAGIISFVVLILIIGFIQHLLHLIYANLILVTRKYHRMPGYAGVYLGRKGKVIITISKFVGNFGALLAYIIITGIFLKQLLGPIFGGSEFLYATILFLLEAIIIFFGIGILARVELFMTSLLIIIVILIVVQGSKFISADNFTIMDLSLFFLPYGAVLFALDGNGSIPIVVKLLKKDKEQVRKVIRVSTLLSIAIVLVFTFTIVGVTGGNTTPDALTGLNNIFERGVISVAIIFGILTMITSFLGVAESIKETLSWDYNVDKNLAWAIAVFVPYILYIMGLKNLIGVISFAGGVAGGLSAIILILIFVKLKKEKEKTTFLRKDKLALFTFTPHHIFSYTIITLFICGIAYEIWNFISNL